MDDFLIDLEKVEEIIRDHPADGEEQLEQLYLAYCGAPSPKEGEKATMWYRMRLMVLDLWEDWRRITLYLRWRDEEGKGIDGTNNGAERAIGWG